MSNRLSVPGNRAAALDSASIRQDFPILRQRVHGRPLVYLDNASTTQKPQVGHRSSDALLRRGERQRPSRRALAQRAATERLSRRRAPRRRVPERAASRGRSSSCAARPRPSISWRQSYGRSHVGPGDEIVISAMEHHSNIVPWQILCEEKGARLRIIPISDAGELDLDAYETLLDDRTRIVVGRARLERARDDQPGRGDRSSRAPPRDSGARRWRSGGRAHGGRRAGAGMRLLRVLRPQDVRSDRHRRALRDRGDARGDAAVSERRRHDQLGHVRANALQRPAAPIRSRHAGHRRSRRPRGRDRLSHRGSGSTASRRTSTSCWSTRPAPSRGLPGDPRDRHGRGRKPAFSRSSSTACTRTTSGRSSIARAWRFAPAITAVSR